MSVSNEFDPAAVRLAVLGLRDAYTRHHGLAYAVGQDEDAMTVTAVNFVNWACALDERLGETDDQYERRRNDDPDGRLLPGLRYVRDRHMHQVVVSMTDDSTPFFGGAFDSITFSAGVVWRPASEMAGPSAKHARGDDARLRLRIYEEELQNRPALVGLAATLRFITAKVTARDVILPDWHWPVPADPGDS